MHIFFESLVGLHALFALAIVVGYVLAAVRGGAVNPFLVWGARLQLVVGLLMMAFADAAGEVEEIPAFHPMTEVKLLVALGVVALVEIANARQRKGEPKPVLVHVAGVLALVNVVAGLWMYLG